MRLWMFKFVILLTLTFVHISSAGIDDLNPGMIVSGNVYINGAAAPADTVIKAMSGGEVKGSVTISTSGAYFMRVNYSKGLVDFYVNDVKAASMNWTSNPQTLNLSVTVAHVSQTGITTATTATATSTPTVASPKATTAAEAPAGETDTVKPEETAAPQEKNEQQETAHKPQAAQSPWTGIIVVAFVFVLVSKVIIGGRK